MRKYRDLFTELKLENKKVYLYFNTYQQPTIIVCFNPPNSRMLDYMIQEVGEDFVSFANKEKREFVTIGINNLSLCPNGDIK